MKIGILTSGNDQLTLFTFLHRYDHEYIIRYDDLFGARGDKSRETIKNRIEEGVKILKKKGCDTFIVSPLAELHFKETEKNILPLFTKYLQQECFSHSLIGKIGILGDYSDQEQSQIILDKEALQYTRTEAQKNIHKFHSPFARRKKDVGLRKHYLNKLSVSEPLVNKVIKTDLNYFKDANIDTLIPLNYGYFQFQKTISKHLNFKKIRFHKIEKIEQIFKEITSKEKQGNYTITVIYTDHGDQLRNHKHLIRLLQRGKSIEITRKKM